MRLKPLIAAFVLVGAGGVGGLYWAMRQQAVIAAQPPAATEGQKGAAAPSAASALPKGSFKPTEQQWTSLKLTTVIEQTFRSELVTDGKIAIDENRATPVFSPYSGVVKRLAVNPGDHIDAGQLLFTIEATDMVQAENDFIVALDGLRTADSQLGLARLTEQRQHGLFDAKATPLKDWQQAQADLVSAENTKRSAEIGLEAVRNRLRILKKTDAEIQEFEKTGKINPETPIYAPIAGTVVQRKVGPGQFITSGASDPSGDPVFVIGNLSTVWLVANVREADTQRIALGQEASFRVLSAADRVVTCKINYVAELLDPNTRRLLVRATVDNSERQLKPEMFARVTIYTTADKSSPAVPRSAVIYEGDDARVWALTDGKALMMRTIKVGASAGNLLQVLDGLAVGDQVVSSGTLFIDRAASGETGG